MNRTILLATAAVLSGTAVTGCASTNQVLAGEPDEVLHVAYPPATVAACLTHRNKQLRLIERADGAMVARFRNGYGGVTKALSLYPEGTGTRIEVRHNSFMTPGWKWKRCVGLEPMQPGDTGELAG